MEAVSAQRSAVSKTPLRVKKQKFRQLTIWQKAMMLITEVYQATAVFPKEELYGLTSQLRRAAVSVAMNIAEGSGADTDQEFRRFLVLASRSGYETMCGIEVAMRLKYLPIDRGERLLNQLEELSAMTHGFVKKLTADR